MKLHRTIPTQVFAHVGNIGNTSSDAHAIAGIISGWRDEILEDANEDARQRGSKIFQSVVSCGGNTIANGGGYLDYDISIGANFFQFIQPYFGTQGNAASETQNSFLPAPDDTDWLNNGGWNFDQFFLLGDTRNDYYEVIYNNVHFFVLDSSQYEPDGKTIDSKQAQWLKLRLLLSTATWKIVVLAKPVYSSATSVDTDVQWNFAQWGADLVLSGGPQCYERVTANGTVFIQNGLGGTGTSGAIVSLLPTSNFFYNTTSAVGRITTCETSLLYELLDLSGNVVDSVTLLAEDKVSLVPQPPSATVIQGVQCFSGAVNVTTQTPYLGAGIYYNYATKEAVAWHGFLNCWAGFQGTGGGAIQLSGGVQAFAGSGSPATKNPIPKPANSAGTYYDYTNKVNYFWNPTMNSGSGGWEGTASGGTFAAINTATGQQFFCGYGAPSALIVPANAAGIYYDFQGNQLLNWNPTTNKFE
jgi:hypothetical protein